MSNTIFKTLNFLINFVLSLYLSLHFSRSPLCLSLSVKHNIQKNNLSLSFALRCSLYLFLTFPFSLSLSLSLSLSHSLILYLCLCLSLFLSSLTSPSFFLSFILFSFYSSLFLICVLKFLKKQMRIFRKSKIFCLPG